MVGVDGTHDVCECDLDGTRVIERGKFKRFQNLEVERIHRAESVSVVATRFGEALDAASGTEIGDTLTVALVVVAEWIFFKGGRSTINSAGHDVLAFGNRFRDSHGYSG